MGHEFYVLLMLVILLIYLAGWAAAVHAALTARTSQGAIAWGVSLVFMPVIALFPYTVFGRNRFGRYVAARRTRNRRFREITKQIDLNSYAPTPKSFLSAPGLATVKALVELTQGPFAGGNHAQLLIDGAQTFDALFAALRAAEKYIVIQFFIVADDNLGRRLKDCLLRKANEGLRVYFLVDGVGSHGLPDAYLDELRAAGIQACRFLSPSGRAHRFQWNFRNHRKIAVIDGEQAFIGGLNASDEYLGLKPPLSPWRDTHMWIRGPAVASIQLAFIEDWYWATGDIPELAWRPQLAVENQRCQVVASGPADEQETCLLFFVQAINSAVQRIWIATPYYVPDEAVVVAFRLAILRGVDVRLLIPERADHRIMFLANQLYASEAVCAGVKVYRYAPGFMHQKVVLIDNQAAAVGSANLDNRSLRLNFEIMALIVDPDFAAAVEAMLVTDFNNARPLELAECEHVPLLRRLGMQTARLCAPIL